MSKLGETAERSKEADARVAMWRDMFRMEGWQELVAYLESRYMELSDETPDSVKGVAARNSQLRLIRGIFGHIKHDFREQDALLKELASMNDFDDQLPDPFAPV